MKKQQNNKQYIVVVIVLILAFTANRVIKYYEKVKGDQTKNTQIDISSGIITVKQVLNIVTHEAKFSFNIDTGPLKKTLLNLWKFKVQTSKHLKYSVLATVQIGYQENDLIDPDTKSLRTKNFPPFRIKRIFLQLQKIDLMTHSFLNKWSAQQINKYIGYEAMKDLKLQIGQNPTILQIVDHSNLKLNQIFYNSNKNQRLLPIQLGLDLQTIDTAEFSIKQYK